MRHLAVIASIIISSSTIFLITEARSQSTAEEVTNLDRFIGDFPRTCEAKGAFEKFRRSVSDRYNYDDKKAPDLSRPNKVAIPSDLRSAFGKAALKYEGESTHVVIPLTGTYRGLKTHSVVFDFGDNNGVWITSLAFNEPLVQVRKKLGPDAQKADHKLQALLADMGFYAKIDTFLGRPAIRCNRST